ncbi:conserved hypothetical protein [Histoplasma capsulatum var. duboisii H88]|uniref:F-box domain-containing protein n=2 Tax=Ajellomyces capsulatus TaxID=5037 RepID=F0UUF0_AJEC8|nr:conserved hypothetical protein [Histoplasma capsulatum H143]EGC49527.1 conserved hypothetical protein [Histoplasma capsulatum var. duboisii H88]
MPSRVEVSDDNHAISSKCSRNDTGYLTTLPPEILREILQYVGADELRANNLDRLLISKYWYCIASAVLLEDVKLSATGLTKFLALQKATPGNSGPEHQPQHKEVTCTRARTISESESELVDGPISPISTRTSSLAICLTGYSGWATHIDPETQQISPERFKILADWTEKTRADMHRLSSWLGTLKTLTRFRFQAEGESSVRTIPANLFEHMKSYLHADAIALMCRSIPVERLRVLELDTCGSAFLARGVDGAKPGHASDSEHICPLIGRYVPYLQQLRVRMHRICPEVFGVGNKNNLQYTTARKEFVFHLSLYDPLKGMTRAKSAGLCSFDTPCRRDVLINKMIEGANVAAMQMPNLKATVLYHVYPSDLVAMDCRTGDTKMVDSQVDWLDNEDVVFEDRRSPHSTSGVCVTVCAF